MATSAPSREETLAQVRVVRELGDRTPGTYLGHRDEEPVAESAERGTARTPEDVVLETYANIGSRALERVADLARKLRDAPPHPHLVKVISVERIGTGLSVVTEFVDGVPLDDVFFGLSLGGRLRAVVDVLAALSALHGAGLVHGGILRGSSFVEATGRTKLGFAYRQPLCLRKDTHAPEALLGDEAAIGVRTDVYGAGVMLWEAVTGRVLFGNDPPERVIERQLGGRVAEALPPKADRWARTLLPVIERALAVDPKERHASAAELAAAVRIAVRARLMMHEDVVEEIWPAETKPKHTSGVVPAAEPAEPIVAIAASQHAPAPEPVATEPPPEPGAPTMERDALAEGAASGIVPVAPVAPITPKRRKGLRSILLLNVAVVAVVSLVAVVTAMMTARHARAPEPVAAHPDAASALSAARPRPAAAPRNIEKPAAKPAPEVDHPAARPHHKPAKPAPRSPRLYDPSEI